MFFEQQKNKNGRIEISFSHLKEKPVFFKPKSEDKYVITFNDENGKSYFFKANSKYSLDQIEILAYVIRKAMGLPVVKTAPCQYTDENGQVFFGTLSESYLNDKHTTNVINGSYLMDLQERFFGNSVGSHMLMLENFCETKRDETGIYHNLPAGIRNELLKEFHYAFMVMDSDFFEANIEYLILNKKTHKEIELAPHVDNSMAFLVKNFKEKTYTPEELKENMPEIANNFEYPFHLHVNPFEKGSIDKMLSSIKNEYKDSPSYRNFVNTANEIKCESEFAKYFAHNPNFEFDPKILFQATAVFRHSRQLIKELTATPSAQEEHVR